ASSLHRCRATVAIIGEDQQLVGSTVRQVTPNGIIFTVASAQKPADVTAPRPFAGANGPATAAQFGPSWGMRVSGDGSFYIADTTDNLVLRVANWLPTSTFSGSQTVTASSDGKQFQVFDAAGRQLKTVDAFTNATLFAFGYDAGGRLATVTDVSGNVTQIVRDAGGTR
ncbi:MAG TPA: hypothetical protein VH044_13260, partial [Polyangiaceae bacterium]|nr:hypothetical protein [Polyangiaceae bacterium]